MRRRGTSQPAGVGGRSKELRGASLRTAKRTHQEGPHLRPATRDSRLHRSTLRRTCIAVPPHNSDDGKEKGAASLPRPCVRQWRRQLAFWMPAAALLLQFPFLLETGQD